MRERHGSLFEIRTVGGRLLVAGSPALASEVFNAPADVLRAGEGNRRVLGWLFGESSLILLDEERHLDHRRLLLPAFHGLRLEHRAKAMRELAEMHLDRWPLGEEVAALPRMRELALDVAMDAVLGGRHDERYPLLRDAMLALQRAHSDEGGEGDVRLAVESAEEIVSTAVADRRARHGGAEDDDALSLLLDARDEGGSPLSDAEVRDEVMTLILAGTETTAGSLAWTLERLSRAPVALARAVADAAEGGPYIDAVIRETLRMRPVVPMSARLVKRPFRLGECTVAPGTTIVVSALLIHHLPQVYPEPMAFRPERFVDQQPGTYSWIPFGGGMRRCIGGSFALAEMRIVLSALLSRLAPRCRGGPSEGARSRGNTMLPADGAKVVLVPLRGAAR